jgi:ABC-type Na+ transport system ATPase subunit NatA
VKEHLELVNIMKDVNAADTEKEVEEMIKFLKLENK